MKFRQVFLVITLPVLFLMFHTLLWAGEIPSSAETWNLKRCFGLALKNSENIAFSGEAIKKAEAQYHQALGKSLPEFSLHYSSLWQDQKGLPDLGSLSGSFTKSPLPESSLRMKLPLFTGYRELAALKAGGSLLEQREHEKRKVELTLFDDLASSYYAVLLAEQNLRTTEKILALNQERFGELKERERVGRSRKVEVLDTEAEIAIIESQIEDARRTVRLARNLLSFLTGVDVTGTLDENPGSAAPLPLSECIRKIDTRPDVLAKTDAVFVALGAVRTARSDYFPGLDMTANYYTKRTGFREPIDWDFDLGLTAPLWSWGSVRHSVLEAGASLRQAEIDRELTRRQAELEIKDAHSELESSLKRISLQEKALDLARQSYENRIEDYRRGLVTNFEVIEALNRLHRTQLALDAVRFESVLNGLKLMISTGSLPE